MTDIKKILETNTQFRVDRLIPREAVITNLESKLGQSLPADYLEFLQSGGLCDLRFKYQVMGPDEILDHLSSVSKLGLVPFASSGTGDLICWSLEQFPSTYCYYWDHETDTIELIFDSFAHALSEWRF